MKNLSVAHSAFRNPFLILLSALVIGIVLQYYCQDKVSITALWVVFSIAFLLSLILQFKKIISEQVRTLRFAVIVTMVVVVGMLSTYYSNIKQNEKWYGHLLENSDAIKVKVIDAALSKERTVLLPVAVQQLHSKGKWVNAMGNFNLYIYKSDSLKNFQIGDELVLPNVLSTIKSSGNPFAFNYADYASRRGIFHQAFIAHNQVMYVGNTNQQWQPFTKLRKQLLHTIDTNVNDSTTASLIAAVLLNERSNLSDELWQAYSATGIVHIIAISGAHVIIFCQVVLYALLFIRHQRWKPVKYFLATMLVWLYLAITGFPPSAVRAVVMFTIFAISLMINREHKPLNTWAAAGFLLLVIRPIWLFDVGVQLSFLAVLSIQLFYKPIFKLVNFKNKFLNQLWSLFALSIAVQLLVFPLVIFYFHQFPLWGLIANLPAAVFSTILMVGSLIMFVLGSFMSCIWLGNMLIFFTQKFHVIIEFMAAHTPTSFRALYINGIDYWLLMVFIAMGSVFFFSKNKRALYTSLACILLLLVSFIYQEYQALYREQIIVYNVSKKSLIDEVSGKTITMFGTHKDSVDKKTFNYTLAAPRLGFRISQQNNELVKSKLWEVSNKKILWLGKDLKLDSKDAFPVDFLVVSKNIKFQPELWQQVFQPKEIIIDGSLPRWKAIKWKNELQAQNLVVHWVQDDGAWVFGK